MEGGKENYDACARLLSLAKRNEDRSLVIEGIADAFEGGKIPELPPSLAEPLPNGDILEAEQARLPEENPPPIGAEVSLSLPEDAVRCFPSTEI